MTKYVRGNAKRLAWCLACRQEDTRAIELAADHACLNYEPAQLAKDMGDLWEYICILESLTDDEEIEKAIAKRIREEEAQ